MWDASHFWLLDSQCKPTPNHVLLGSHFAFPCSKPALRPWDLWGEPISRFAIPLCRGKPRVRPRRRKNTVKIPGSRWTAERSPECASLPLLCRTSTSLGACGWPNGCLVLSSVRGLQMNVCWINGTRSLVERSHECPRRSDQTISMHTRRPYRVWMGLSPSIELNNANGKSVHMPRRIAQSPNG